MEPEKPVIEPIKTVSNSPISESHLLIAKHCSKVYKDDYLKDAEEFVDHPETDCQAVMFKDSESNIVVCFRGSDDVTDWKMNFKLFTSQFPRNSNREVHAGFLVQWLSVKNEVMQKVESLIEKHGTTKVIFCGHSAGAGICCVAAYDMGLELMKKSQEVEVVTLGSPRMCNKEFQKYFDSKLRCCRYVLDKDIITLFPLNFFGYHHVGRLVHMKDEGKIGTIEPSAWLKIKWLIRGFFSLDFGVRDHFVGNYTKEMLRICNK